MERDELPHVAALREVEEETGLCAISVSVLMALIELHYVFWCPVADGLCHR
ncbi:MAG: NUDIX domain-containing protein [Chloroflexota bacterium]